jgi:putative membrane protein insertion efficiency factor
MIGRLFIGLIKLYQRHVSPYLGSGCKYRPTCSQYAIEAIEIHGAFIGLVYGFYRVLRCNPFSKGGYDPVPQKRGKLGR